MSIVDPEDEKNRVNLVVKHKEFTKNLKNLFETIWAKGKEIKFEK
jgi:hypothetical protein